MDKNMTDHTSAIAKHEQEVRADGEADPRHDRLAEFLKDAKPYAEVVSPAVAKHEQEVRAEYGVNLGFTIAQVATEQQAEEWVQSYRDCPPDDGDPMPFVVTRMLTTTTWTPIARADALAEGQES